jgi:hypothetical protein
MALTEYSGDTDYVASLDDLPNDVGGLTAAQLKAVFDQFGTEFVAWFNATHVAELDALTGSASETAKGIVELATAAETTTGTSDTLAVHPKGLKVELDKKLALAGGTMTGALVADNNTDYTTAQARNITLSTGDASGGDTGDVWIKYTA